MRQLDRLAILLRANGSPSMADARLATVDLVEVAVGMDARTAAERLGVARIGGINYRSWNHACKVLGVGHSTPLKYVKRHGTEKPFVPPPRVVTVRVGGTNYKSLAHAVSVLGGDPATIRRHIAKHGGDAPFAHRPQKRPFRVGGVNYDSITEARDAARKKTGSKKLSADALHAYVRRHGTEKPFRYTTRPRALRLGGINYPTAQAAIRALHKKLGVALNVSSLRRHIKLRGTEKPFVYTPNKKSIRVEGVNYPTIKAALDVLGARFNVGMNYSTLRKFLKEHGTEKPFEYACPPIRVGGVTYPTLKAAIKALHADPRTLYQHVEEYGTEKPFPRKSRTNKVSKKYMRSR